jgi:glucose-1-phosphate thymidylyltransferase
MKGIVLAGGTGSRLWPITKVISKQLLPVYDKPMIYYPLATLMLAGVRDILIITTPHDRSSFEALLGDGSQFGIKISYATQPKPEGLAQAFIIGEDFLNGDSCLMILGDNIFHGAGLGRDIIRDLPSSGAHIYIREVANPEEYGVLTVDENEIPISIAEKPKVFTSSLAVTGLYFFDADVCNFAKSVSFSSRGELEITSLINFYLQQGKLSFSKLSRGTAWLDTGSVKSLSDASLYIRILEERTGEKIGCPEEIAFLLGIISESQLRHSIQLLGSNPYSLYLESLLD